MENITITLPDEETRVGKGYNVIILETPGSLQVMSLEGSHFFIISLMIMQYHRHNILLVEPEQILIIRKINKVE